MAKRQKSPQNRGETKALPRGLRFGEGQKGNPGGRPKGFGSLIRDLTDDGAELTGIALNIARGKMSIQQTSFVTGDTFDVVPNFKERMEAIKWLSDRGWGKPTETVEHRNAQQEIEKLTDAELAEQLERHAKLRRAKSKGDGGE
ncbi:MAG: hypothetical protein KGL39_53865 [Patescibacteria group bacterium]|nr:hypothetical protein [Patescibacteria group bacterium]